MPRHNPEFQRNREIAKMLDEETYQGPPCKFGHPGKRIVKYNGMCWHCYRASLKNYRGGDARRRPIGPRLWLSAKHRAIRDGIEFNIEKSDVVVPTHCPISGEPLVDPSLDRKDNSKGYVKGNVFVVSMKMNRLKSCGSIEDFEKIIAYMKQ